MKTVYLVIFLLSLPLVVSSQETGKDAVVSAIKMNVLYRGMDNPVEIAVPGFTSDKIAASITNGTIRKVGNSWVVAPGPQDESVITVMANNKKVSDKSFRIKNVPEPVAVFAGKNSGTISKDVALKTDALDVELKNFDWDLKYTLVSFTLAINKDNYDYEEAAKGNKITEKMKSLINTIQPGKKLIFVNIKAMGPDGRIRELNPIVLTIN